MAKKPTSHQISRQLTSIKYTSRDYASIKNDLVEYAKRYYPDSFKDFNDASFGALMLDTVAYVGDILSFYLDYQANESFVDTALEPNNILRHGRALGYKHQRSYSSTGIVNFYIMVPTDSFGTAPDLDYMPLLKKGSQFSSIEGTLFTLSEDVDFSDPNNEMVVAIANPATGSPTYYAVKAEGYIISGKLGSEVIQVGEFEKFLRLKLTDSNITEIVSIYDSEGHQYYEVDYLSQNIVYSSVNNRSSTKTQATNILKAIPVARRFIIEHELDGTYIQFGFGSDSEIFNESVADPSELVMRIHGRNHITDASLDPTNLLATDKFGIAPSATNLTVIYRSNTSNTVNASAGSVNTVVKKDFSFENRMNLDDGKVNDVIDSLEVSNEERVIGSVSAPDSEELRHRIKNTFSAQNRAVTKQDYIIASYSLPPQFGAVKRCTIVKDHDSFKRNLNMYVVSEDGDQKLVATNSTVKSNLKTWLNGYKMINDTVDIMDAKIVNLGLRFRLLGEPEINKYDILSLATVELRKHFEKQFDIGEPISLTSIFKVLNIMPGVTDTLHVEFINMSGGMHSDYAFNIDSNMSADGRVLIAPEDVIFEIKYPTQDIRGHYCLMGIKRYIADADTTITNAFRDGLRESSRGTGSNMGASDVLEVFSIYGQGHPGQYMDASSGSVELSRALIKFPVSDISTDRTNSVIPGSGSIQFYLRMYNAKHAFTLPVSSTVSVVPVSQSWEEGTGLDMEGYLDKTRDGIGANWNNKSSASTWDTKGGQFHSGTNSNYTAHFANGDEDIEIDISQVVEDWIAGANSSAPQGKTNYGLGVFLTSSLEGYFSSSTGTTTGSVLHNLLGSTKSYYTKKFFSKGSEYFFKRPCIEARWYSAKKDDRGVSYVSSSLASKTENLNTIFLYNNVRGQLRDLPDVGQAGAVIFVQLYTSASNGELIKNASGYNLRQTGTLNVCPDTNCDKPPQHAVTGGYVSTGIYSCSFAVNTTASVLYDRWFSGSTVGSDIEESTIYYTGSVLMNQFSSSADNFNPNPQYVTKVTNLKDSYTRDEVPRFRVFVREKDWSPNAYTVSNKNIKSEIIDKAYFKVVQIYDNSTIIPFGTGTVEHTSLSYDSKGNYFDLDMDLLESGYAYGIKFAYYINGAYHEQSQTFKFRVE